MDEVIQVRDEQGRFTANAPMIGQPITPANARIMAAKSAESRRNRAAQAARNRTVARLAASDPTIQSSYDAWGSLVADTAEAIRQAASEGKPRGDDLLQVGRAMGMVAQAGDKQGPEAGAASDLVRALSDMLATFDAAMARRDSSGE